MCFSHARGFYFVSRIHAVNDYILLKMKVLVLIIVAIMLISIFATAFGATIDTTDKEDSEYEKRTSDIIDEEDFQYEERTSNVMDDEKSEYIEQTSDAIDEENFAYEEAFDTMDEEDSASEYLLDILQAKALLNRKKRRCTTKNGQVRVLLFFFLNVSSILKGVQTHAVFVLNQGSQ